MRMNNRRTLPERPALKALFAVLLCLLMALTAAYADVAADQDTGIQHRVLLTSQTEHYSVYQIVYYGNNTHCLKAVTIITRFPPESGVTEEFIENYDPNKAYPNISQLDFASHEVYTVDGYVHFAMHFDDLDVTANKKIMMENGYLLMTDPAAMLTSDDYVNSLSNYGTIKEVPLVDYDDLGFHF